MVDLQEVSKALLNEQYEACKHYFSLFDKDGSGSIPVKKLRSLLKEMDLEVDSNCLNELIQPFDPKGDQTGSINFEEFMILVPKVSVAEEACKAWQDELKEIFAFCDSEGNGYISVTDFKDVVRALDASSTEEALDDLIAEIDRDGTGTVEYEDFMELMSSKQHCNIYHDALNPIRNHLETTE